MHSRLSMIGKDRIQMKRRIFWKSFPKRRSLNSQRIPARLTLFVTWPLPIFPRTGPTFAIELPIFNQGQARIARGEAALRQAQDKFEALAIDVRSEIRELRDELASKRDIARFYQNELLPGQRQILNESLLNYNAIRTSCG